MRINLLPVQYRPEPLINPLRLTVMLVCGFLTFGTAIWLLILTMQLGTEKQRIATVEQQINNYKGTVQQIDQYEKRLASLKQRLAQVEKIKAAYFQYPFVLKRVAGSLKDEMWVDSIDMTALDSFQINGKSLIFPNIGGLLKNLQKLPDLHDVKLTQLAAADTADLEVYNFAIKLKPGGGGLANAQAQKK